MSSVVRAPRVRKAVLTVTNSALNRINSLIRSQQPKPVVGIRVGVRSRGCNGLSYTMNYVDEAEAKAPALAKDEVVKPENSDVKIFVDPKALLYILGSEMDFKDDDLSQEFTFKNPNEKGKCGCGESFNV